MTHFAAKLWPLSNVMCSARYILFKQRLCDITVIFINNVLITLSRTFHSQVVVFIVYKLQRNNNCLRVWRNVHVRGHHISE